MCLTISLVKRVTKVPDSKDCTLIVLHLVKIAILYINDLLFSLKLELKLEFIRYLTI